jgi:methionyl-tRNA synthetase
MNKKRLITIALPYSNGDIHLGHLLEGIQADIWNRYNKLNNNETIFISGNDAHGSAISIKANQENITPEKLIENVHNAHSRDYKKFNIDFDHFGTTHTETNKKNITNFYLKNKHLFVEKNIDQFYDEEKKQFLSDRYIKGTCPFCKAKEQYGDNCESCGKHYTPVDLIDPKSTHSNSTPILKETTQIFFKADHFREEILEWLEIADVNNAVKNKLNEWLNSELRPWDISREDPYFGFKIPEYDNKYFYVWIDAPIGYISIVEDFLSLKNKDIDVWSKNSDYEIHQFIGKDLINFHGIYWISELLGFNYQLPTSINTHGFLTIDDEKISKSKNNSITAKDFEYPVESLRYYFASRLTSQVTDLNLDINKLKEGYNNQIVGGFINLGSRTFKILEKNFNSQTGEVLNQNILNEVESIFPEIIESYENKNFRNVISNIEKIIHLTNQYINTEKPWALVKEDKEKTLEVLSTVISVFIKLNLLLEPIIPEVSKTFYDFFSLNNLNFDDLNVDFKKIKIKKYKHVLKRI